jgi:ABC-2 type transport system ATP-binding protein
MLILEAESLQKTYRSRRQVLTAVADVSLKLAAGEVLAFLGPNGAGKTTTIKMIAGLILPDAGWVRVAGRDPHRDVKALRAIGAVLEGNRNLYWRLTPIENLEYFGVLRGLTRRVAQRQSQVLLERFELGDKRNALVQTLSRGMQQKLAIAVALMHDPKLLLLDEPTLGLDVEATESVKALVREIAAEGRAILLTTHQLDIAEELSNRVAVINRGEIVVEEPTAELIRQFSDSAYVIQLEQPIDALRASKVIALGAAVELNKVTIREPEMLYLALEILRPLPIVTLGRQQANLTEIFLSFVRAEPLSKSL